MKDSIRILGVAFSKMNMKETVNEIADKVESNTNKVFHIITGNPEIVLSAQKDEFLQKIIREADLVTPDGVGIVLASKWQGKPLTERVTGYDLLIEVLKRGNDANWSFYFLGADEKTSKEATDKILNDYPNVRILGRHNGYFNEMEEENIILDIQKVKPDLLIVALGAPKAEKWIYKYKSKLPVKVTFGVGGSLDGITGKVKRAPEIWQKLNLEWFYRLMKQPSRWRRQIILPVFACKSLVEAIRLRFEEHR